MGVFVPGNVSIVIDGGEQRFGIGLGERSGGDHHNRAAALVEDWSGVCWRGFPLLGALLTGRINLAQMLCGDLWGGIVDQHERSFAARAVVIAENYLSSGSEVHQ